MFTSDINTNNAEQAEVVNDTAIIKQSTFRHVVGHLCFAVFCLFFGAIYEAFSFGVYSYYMIYSFAFPFVTGMILLLLLKKKKELSKRFLSLITCATLTATLGSIATGVVQIYGSENRLLIVYPVLAAILYIGALASVIKRGY